MNLGDLFPCCCKVDEPQDVSIFYYLVASYLPSHQVLEAKINLEMILN